jgi:O-antigen/teichoic acid export membrane protein
LGLGGGALFLGLGAAGAVGGYAIGMAAAFALSLWQLRDLRSTTKISIDIRKIYALSAPLFFVYFFAVFTVNVDMLAAKRFLTSQESGLYGSCSAITRIVYVVATPIYLVLFSRLSSLRAQQQHSRGLAAIVTAIVAAGLAVGALIPWLFGAQVLMLAFGSAFVTAAPILRIQWVTTSLLILEGMGIFVLLGEERTKGMWLLLIPCLMLAGLLGRFHVSAVEVACDSLVAALAGLLIVAALLLRAQRPS